jgi:hypothetical protein
MERPICFHAILDERNRIVGSHSLFGVYGDWHRKDEEFSPFVLGPNGEIDYGTGWDYENERTAHIEVRDVPIIVGQLFQYMSKSGDHKYRIVSVTELPAGG